VQSARKSVKRAVVVPVWCALSALKGA